MRSAIVILLGVLAVIQPSCAPRRVLPPVTGPRPPADLMISVVVGPGGELEPARFVIEPGGQLRASTGAGATRDTLPPRTRNLSASQVTDLYGLIVRRGLALPGEGGPIAGTPIAVSVVAHDERSTAIHDSAVSDDAQELVERIRRLARLDG